MLTGQSANSHQVVVAEAVELPEAYTEELGAGLQANAVFAYLKRKYGTVQDLRSDRQARINDIDFDAGNGATYEVKTDTWAGKTGNFAFEISRDGGRVGCFYRSKARYWAYLLADKGEAYVFELSKAQHWLAVNFASVEFKAVRGRGAWRGKDAPGDYSNMVAAIVPIERFVAEVEHERVILGDLS